MRKARIVEARRAPVGGVRVVHRPGWTSRSVARVVLREFRRLLVRFRFVFSPKPLSGGSGSFRRSWSGIEPRTARNMLAKPSPHARQGVNRL